MPFLRQLYKQKPQAYGPPSVVQASLFKNADGMGIDPGLLVGYWPFWEKAGKASNLVTLKSFTPPLWNNYGLELDRQPQATEDVANIGNSDFCIFVFIQEFLGYLDAYPTFISSGDTGTGEWMLRSSSSGATGFPPSFYGNSGAITASYPNSIEPPLLLCIERKGSVASLYHNGTVIATDTSATANLNTSKVVTIGGGYGTTNRRFSGTLNQCGIIKQAGIAAQLSDNPYALIQRVPPVFYSVPGGGVLPTFNPLFLNAAQPTRVIQ